MDVDINNVEFCLINIYAPNNHVQRKTFMSDLCKFMVTRQNIIFGGDLTFVENIALDRKGGDSLAGDIGVKEMNALCNDLSLMCLDICIGQRGNFLGKVGSTWKSFV